MGLSTTKFTPRERMLLQLNSISEDYQIDRKAFPLIIDAAEWAFRPPSARNKLTHEAFMIYLEFKPKTIQSLNKRLNLARLESIGETSWQRLLSVVKETRAFFKKNPNATEAGLTKHLKKLNGKLPLIELVTITSILNSAGIPNSLED